MKTMLRKAIALLLCLSLCLSLAPAAFAGDEDIYIVEETEQSDALPTVEEAPEPVEEDTVEPEPAPEPEEEQDLALAEREEFEAEACPVRFYAEKGYKLTGLTVTDAAGETVEPVSAEEGLCYLLSPGEYRYAYHDARGIFLDIGATAFTVDGELTLTLALTPAFADNYGSVTVTNPDCPEAGGEEELLELMPTREELTDRLVDRLLTEYGEGGELACGEVEAFYATQDLINSVGLQLRDGMVNRQATVDVSFTAASTLENQDLFAMLTKAVEHTGDHREGDTLRRGYARFNCSYAYRPTGYGYNYELTFTLVYRTNASQEQAVVREVERLVGALGLRGKSDYEKVLAIHTYLYQNVNYDYPHYGDQSYQLQFSDYAALINKIAVCQGFSIAFYRLCLASGVQARCVLSTRMDHAWNIVKLGGSYYELDVTWDSNWRENGAPASELPHYFLRGSDWWLRNHTLSGYSYSTIGDEFYSNTADYCAEFEGYTLSKTDYVPGSDPDEPIVIDTGVEISAANFPDAVFRAYISKNLDADSNGLLSDKELAAVTALDLSGDWNNPGALRDLTGLRHFTALRELYCNANSIETLDLSQNPALETVQCSANPITGIKLKNPALRELLCYDGRLTALDLSACPALRRLSLDNNSLTALDLSGCPSLSRLDCAGNGMTVLSLSGNPELIMLDCTGNNLSILDISACTGLVNLVGGTEPSVSNGAVSYVDPRGQQYGALWLDEGVTLLTKTLSPGRYTFSLNLSDSFELKLYVRELDDYDACTISYGGKSMKVSEGTPIGDGSGYWFLLSRCAAKEMADAVHVTVSFGDLVLHERDYSIRAYCLAMMDMSVGQKLKDLCQAVLDYGSYAQSFFNYNTAHPANEGTNPFPLLTVPESYRAKDQGASTGIRSITATLSLEYQTVLTVLVKPESAAYTLDQYTVTVTDSRGMVISCPTGTLSDGRFTVTVNGIAGKELGTAFTVTLRNRADGTAISKTVSALSYAYAAQSAGNAGLSELCRALYRYNTTAVAYFQG